MGVLEVLLGFVMQRCGGSSISSSGSGRGSSSTQQPAEQPAAVGQQVDGGLSTAVAPGRCEWRLSGRPWVIAAQQGHRHVAVVLEAFRAAASSGQCSGGQQS